MDILRRLDAGIARGEAAVAVVVLIGMILLAALQAVIRKIAGYDVEWANDWLANLTFIDGTLQNGTLWLAFLGASLAAHDDKHIAIDVLHRVVSPKVQSLLKLLANVAGAITAFYLARVFYTVTLRMAADRPFDYDVLTLDGSAHICDAPAAALAESELTRPGIFCAIRDALAAIGTPVETPDAAMKFIAPVLLLVIAVRFAGKAVIAVLELTGQVEPPSSEPKVH